MNRQMADLKSRTFEGQQAEALSKSKALNIMTSLGMPYNERIIQIFLPISPLSVSSVPQWLIMQQGLAER